MDLQIDDFYRDASAGLLALYQAFPRKITLYVEDLIGHEEPDEFGLPSKRHQSCLGALIWLAEEGYLRYENTLQFQALEQAVLTEKAFIRLSAASPESPSAVDALPPSIRRVQGSFANCLRMALRDGDSERLAQLARQLFCDGLRAKP
ncbi:hypothetical protein MST27_03725 [Pseudomonas sp. PS1]|uniref:Uncharacterized protein n=1 Tax=Stutzerimonas marianensis TaxID=2929513 RepID=A0A9X1W1L8_9GAMM|nr:hypothetical protein [Pseudomonas marianensis]MCJ0972480.1 hypothetical protein [Pseudomonas marianensis]